MKTKIYGMQIKYSCGHIEYGWSASKLIGRIFQKHIEGEKA